MPKRSTPEPGIQRIAQPEDPCRFNKDDRDEEMEQEVIDRSTALNDKLRRDDDAPHDMRNQRDQPSRPPRRERRPCAMSVVS